MTKNSNFIETIYLEATGETPEVRLSLHGESIICGRSLPENAYNFYEPILIWFNKLVSSDATEFALTLDFDYFNSSSGRYINEILYLLSNWSKKDCVRIVWKYEEDDDLMLERGESFQSLCLLNFQFFISDRNK